MIAAIHQPLYLPWQPYFGKIACADVFVFLDDVQYPRSKGFFNRNTIKGPSGPLMLTLPVKSKGRLDAVRDIAVDGAQDWQHKHWKAIALNYAKAPHFETFRAPIEEIYVGTTWQRFSEVSVALIRKACELLGFTTSFVLASDLHVPAGHGAARLAALVKAAGADQYLTGKGAGSLRYMDEQVYADAGVGLLWHEYRQEPYPQLWGPFRPDLAILDLLFNCGPESRDRIVRGSLIATDEG